jgi:hypothetical protein
MRTGVADSVRAQLCHTSDGFRVLMVQTIVLVGRPSQVLGPLDYCHC